MAHTSSPSRSKTFTAFNKESSIGVFPLTLVYVSRVWEEYEEAYSNELRSWAVGEAENLFEKEVALQDMGEPKKWRVNEAGLKVAFESPV